MVEYDEGESSINPDARPREPNQQQGKAEQPPEDSCPHQVLIRLNNEASNQLPVDADKIISYASAPTDISRQVQEEIAKTGTGLPRYHGLATNNLEALLRDKAGSRCYHCLGRPKITPQTSVLDSSTVICPCCGVDSVVPTSEVPDEPTLHAWRYPAFYAQRAVSPLGARLASYAQQAAHLRGEKDRPDAESAPTTGKQKMTAACPEAVQTPACKVGWESTITPGQEEQQPHLPNGDQEWQATTYRIPGEDVVSLGCRVVNAYLNKAASAEDILTACFDDKECANVIRDRYGYCLRGGGGPASEELSDVYLKLVGTEPTASASADLLPLLWTTLCRHPSSPPQPRKRRTSREL